jgi:hypothetical protein
MKTWKCVCGLRHSGIPLKGYAPKIALSQSGKQG